jgi:hypothetical protein
MPGAMLLLELYGIFSLFCVSLSLTFYTGTLTDIWFAFKCMQAKYHNDNKQQIKELKI